MYDGSLTEIRAGSLTTPVSCEMWTYRARVQSASGLSLALGGAGDEPRKGAPFAGRRGALPQKEANRWS
jgi:hypothetical protein